ncbi:DNA/RNA helicase, superfamily II [Caldisphaera lagunensis DSM 15908]|uniref:DNA 3'-5' helicase n=1 Tax=Caldisphaera lagunensis (strain DSM 15908 / JCM 11604 / ANMR 0165 / IC-154) TaxID=1056495 RepID=L0AAB1_CALLD|nr:DEAD/DEAH box helicase [Caldisphaera lagunensis]AFZ70057.1 DNA/RNA helicase, superfamily II [Caldisphaera lagunensis DSM 15908]
MVTLNYYKGLIVSDTYNPQMRYDERIKKYVALAYKYKEINDYYKDSGINIKDHVLQPLPFPIINDKIKLRTYQEKALESWLKTKRGIIVLPTGSGKTHVALKAISHLKQSTLIMVPTIDLLDQWYKSIVKELGTTPGRIGGGYDDINGITISTYDSAYSRIDSLGNKFSFLIFDEVHHLPSEGYMEIAQLTPAPYRLGLTATPEREDGRHVMLLDLVGPIVYRINTETLSGKYLSEYDIERIYVNLKPDEELKYKEMRSKMKDILNRLNIELRDLNDFKRFLYYASRNKQAREALHLWYESNNIAINSNSKIEKLKELLKEYKEDKIIIFTRDTNMAYRISKEFLIPVVTYKTPKDERKEILDNFRNNKYKVIVASNIFDEGVDIPDANLAIIVGGYGTRRQFIQRLGRILRMKEGKRAKLVEIVTKGTSDYSLSLRRRKDV